ncbi:hypothetical protein DSO57_1008225 [Entomophthora muscae]|uniref:Uncharacterized protein n=1 Tax=Entomophthora muscae TaxID=34485 RepID=A0ACC2SWV1_9FUNG|nr:hypothetical protein DSO57_1008225 [Entomophthora muscae]
MEDVLINCLTIGSAFSSCGGWGRLVNKAPFVPLSASKHPHFTSSCHSIPHLPPYSVPSTVTSNRTPGNWSLSSDSGCCSPE